MNRLLVHACIKSNTNALNTFTLSLRAIPPWRESVAIRRSRCEGIARGNLKSFLASLGTRLRRFTPRNDSSLNAFALVSGRRGF